MFSPVDMKGVLRGQCNAPQRECDGFCRSANNEPAAPLQAAWCSYCGHSPVQHARIGTTQDVYFSAPSQLPEVTQTQATRDNAYEIIGPDDESPQGANDISVAEVSPIPPEVNMTDDTAAIDTETAMSTGAATVYEGISSTSASAVVSEGTEPGLVGQHVCYHCDFFVVHTPHLLNIRKLFTTTASQCSCAVRARLCLVL
ncbi:uncharacterized protein LOC119461746 isoform X2 [Dermacentor silvarum]|uniref:uncharacterized protein LOC119461746 isoform X2 n=1 Tax=Dermacentor silvarum TaxID=543639 RepID=UPI002100D178|nr:uncharacterized protein LOC119461746 isoform X2 [Dermacentor silvarum]